MALIGQDLYPVEFALHKKYACSEIFLELVWTHCFITHEIAISLFDANTFDTSQIDRNMLIKGSLLYDIGVYQAGGFEWMPGQDISSRPYVQHTVAGAEILHQEGYSNELIRIAQTHTGVGLSAEDIATYTLQLPPGDYMPATPLEWLACYASKFHSKAPKFKTAEEIETALNKFGADKAERFRQLQASFGVPNIPAFQEKYREWHTGFAFKIKQLQEGGVNLLGISYPAEYLNSAGIPKDIAAGNVNHPVLG